MQIDRRVDDVEKENKTEVLFPGASLVMAGMTVKANELSWDWVGVVRNREGWIGSQGAKLGS